MSEEQTKAIKIFYSYAHKDMSLLNTLAEHLSSLKRQGFITEWYDHHIGAGIDWGEEIDANLNTASIILLLISSSYIASDYCYGREMQRALERNEAKEARVIPIILRPVDWSGAPFAKLQFLPTNGKAITTWSNKDEAFLDVTRGIRKAIEDLRAPQMNLQPPFQQYWNVPYRRNMYFTGQQAIFTAIHDKLRTGDPFAITQPLAISGLGGIGKTQIAVEYAYRHRDDYQLVLWVKADTRQSLILGYVALADMLHLPEKDAQNQNITVETVKQWLNRNNNWLLILDNADDVELVSDFLPSLGKGHILLTTRSQIQGTIAQDIEVEQMSIEDGAFLFLRRAKVLTLEASLDQATARDRAIAEKIVQILGGLPLALDQAAAYIDETGCNLSEYLQRYEDQRTRLLQRRGRWKSDYPEPVATTWSLSFQKVEQINPVAADLLQFCAFLYPSAIPEELIIEGAPYLGAKLQKLTKDLIALDEAMEVLRTYSLVRRNPDTRTLSVHRLVQVVLKERLSKDLQQEWGERTIQAVNATFPTVEFITWPRCQRWLPHAQTCAELIQQYDITFPAATRLLTQTGWYLKERAHYAEAEPLMQRALAIREQQLGPQHLDTAQSLNILAWLYEAQGKYTQAEPLMQQALVIYEQQLGLEHPNTATTLNNLAGLYYTQGKYSLAEPLMQRTLVIREQQLGPQHPQTATSLNNLAQLYRAQGKYFEAEAFYLRALTICEQQLGPQHPQTATSLNNLAGVYLVQNKYPEAEAFYLRALTICEQQLGPEHPQTATSLNNLAELYRLQNKYPEAEAFYLRALTICEQQLGPEHPDTAVSLNNLAGLYWAQNKYSQAEPLYQHALKIREQYLGTEHPDTAASLNNLAELYRAQGQYIQAEPLLQRALMICEQQLEPEHPDVAHYLNSLAELYNSQGKYDEAEPLYQRALAIRERRLGANNSRTIATLKSYIKLLRTIGKDTAAVQLERRYSTTL